MRKVIYILLGVLIIVGIIRIVYEYGLHKEEINRKIKFEKRQREVTKNGAPSVQMLANLKEIENIFYPALSACNPINLATEDGTNYVIFGKNNNKCSFEKYQLSYLIRCNVSFDIVKKYAESGKAGTDYVNDINNDSKYCQILYEGTKN